MSPEYSLRHITDLRPGDHVCCLYETDEEHRALVVTLIRQGLANEEKVLYLQEARPAAKVLGYLREEGVEADLFLNCGQLSLPTHLQSYLPDGRVNPEKLVAWLETETARALAEGYTALRLVGQMDWLWQGMPGSLSLIEYERKINDFFLAHRCLALCFYDRRRFEPALLLETLATHPLVKVGDEVYNNFYYLPVREMRGPAASSAKLDHRLQMLAQLRQAQVRLQEQAAALARTNAALQAEIQERLRAEQELRQQNITARKQAEENLTRLAAILEATPYLVGTADAAGRLLYLNRAGRQMLELDHDTEISRLTLKDTHPPAVGARILQELLPTARRRGVWTGENEFLSRGGRVIPTSQMIVAHQDPQGQVEFFSIIARDITEQKKNQEVLQQREEQLRQIQRLETVGRLAGGVAHDFNNLLMVIMGYIELILNHLDQDNPLRKGAEQISQAAAKGAALTRQLLAFSRRQEIQPRALDLNAVVSDMERMLRRLIGEDIHLATAPAPELLRIKADQGQLEQVLMNLAINAREAMPGGGRLMLRTEKVILKQGDTCLPPESRPGKFVCLTVADTGVGIDKKIISRIFEPFFSTKAPGAGTGLGLSTVSGIVKQHKGWIQVSSRPGHGTTFRIFFPLYHRKVTGKPKENPPPSADRSRGERILLVEDEESVQEFTAMALREKGYILHTAANAAQALEIFEREKGDFHLLFCDVVLPDKPGLQLVEQLRSRKPDLRVLLSSGYPDLRAQWPLIQAKGLPFIQKPCHLSNLLRTIQEVLQENREN